MGPSARVLTSQAGCKGFISSTVGVGFRQEEDTRGDKCLMEREPDIQMVVFKRFNFGTV